MKVGDVDVPIEKIQSFCRRWRITEFSLFGSVLRDDFRADSDVDVLVRFAEGARWRWADWGRMDEELRELFGREVDLVEKAAVESGENRIRREAILRSAEVVYAA